ncbi:hypothetical protein K2X14_10620 [Acetobacter sp. TBRC 12305]|uniref:Uncharacterized protein n=1 Tax=Acetobacter garciniae TaxID=2817435 RepID=A0A939KNC3_9PROT|nr:hypothetical protein [Acetobacter garciniae]MBO1325540.1 hypothetical protein [Acetobacter garciniae]MBX0345288.1 hypothetical protein [Acetobacter garciniae]
MMACLLKESSAQRGKSMMVFLVWCDGRRRARGRVLMAGSFIISNVE